jgi:hypothetical protein
MHSFFSVRPGVPSSVLGLENEKYVVEVMLGFLLTFFKLESGLSIRINFDQFLADISIKN